MVCLTVVVLTPSAHAAAKLVPTEVTMLHGKVHPGPLDVAGGEPDEAPRRSDPLSIESERAVRRFCGRALLGAEREAFAGVGRPCCDEQACLLVVSG
jgi:hypothetical protein